MRAPHRLAAGSVAIATAAVAAAALAPPAVAATASAVTTERLTADVAPGLASATDLGATDSAKRINVTLGLSRPDPAGEAAFTRALYDPASASYHHFLTPSTFAASFGVDPAKYATALDFATAHGLTLASATPARDTLVLTGTVAQAEATFGVALHDYRSSLSSPYLAKSFTSNTTGPLVPAGIGIIGVLGLSDERVAKLDTTKGTLRPAQDGCINTVCTGLTKPQDLWATYDQPSANMGQGSQLAIFGEGQTDDIISDLRGFEAENGLRRIPVTVVHSEPGDYSDDAGAEEWNIDTQSSTGMAPLADREVLYFGTALTDASVLSVFNSWANDATGPKQASASYGECEEIADGGTGAASAVSAGAAYTLMSEQTLSTAVSLGKTLFSSSGDTGAGCPVLPTSTNGAAPQGVPQPNYPADSPNAVSVGGTVLYTTGATPDVRSTEYSWNYTGGGTSFIFPKPSYQNAVSTIAGVCVGKPGGGAADTGTPCRGVPDIAMQSGDIATNGYGITVKGANDQSGGGTSLSSPLMLGVWTRIQAASGDTSGFANPALYRVGTDATRDPGAFFDIGGISNTQPGTTQVNNNFGVYSNLPRSVADPSGWDYLSGFGVPDVTNLMQDIAGRTTPASSAVTADAPLPPVVSSSCDPSGVVTDPAGDATEIVVSTPAGVNQSDLDILRAFVSYDRTKQTLTFNTLVTALGTGTLGQNFRYIFSYGGTEYTAEATRITGGTPSYSLLMLGTGTGARNTQIATLTGTFDATTNTVSVVLPIATFNTAAKPATPLGVGSALGGEDILGQRDTGVATLTADEATGACPFVVGGTAAPGAGPTASLPEAPYAALIPLVGFGALGLVTLRRRRRTARV